MPDKNDTTRRQELDDEQMEGVAGGSSSSSVGKEQQHYTVELMNAQIAQPESSLTTGESETEDVASIKRIPPDVIDPAS